MSNEPHHFHSDDMRGLVARSRDLIAVARVLHGEQPDVSLMSCIGVVLGALRDMDSDSANVELAYITAAIDDLRKRLT